MRGVSPSQTLPNAGGQPPAPPNSLNLHDAAGPARRQSHHVITTSRRSASQPPHYPWRRLHGSSLARSGAAMPSNSTNATPCHPQNPRTTTCTHTKTPPDPPSQHWAARRPDLRPRFARPRPLLAPPKRTDCRLRDAYPLFPNAAISGPRRQCKFTLKKALRRAHTPPLVDDHPEI